MHPDTLSGDGGAPLPRFDTPPHDPVAAARDWLDAARRRGVREPAAATLATADRTGHVSSRTVLVKDVCPEGLVFTSSRHSRKARDLVENPQAACTFYWRETLQQLNVAGRVTELADAQADRLFAERPRMAQAVAEVSRQSHPLDDQAAFEATVHTVHGTADAIERPAAWRAYLLTAQTIEFWSGSPDRLHRRLLCERTAGGWRVTRLQP